MLWSGLCNRICFLLGMYCEIYCCLVCVRNSDVYYSLIIRFKTTISGHNDLEIPMQVSSIICETSLFSGKQFKSTSPNLISLFFRFYFAYFLHSISQTRCLFVNVQTWWRHHMETFSALHFPRGIHRSPVNSTHKGQWRGTLIFSLICARINGWVNNREAGDLRCHRAHDDVTVMIWSHLEVIASRIGSELSLLLDIRQVDVDQVVRYVDRHSSWLVHINLPGAHFTNSDKWSMYIYEYKFNKKPCMVLAKKISPRHFVISQNLSQHIAFSPKNEALSICSILRLPQRDAISRRHFQIQFRVWKSSCFNLYFTEIYSYCLTISHH